MSPIQIDYSVFLHAYDTVHDIHQKQTFFQEIMNNHSCFSEVKWKPTISVKVRPTRVGTTDNTVEAIFKKDLISLLNKVSITNIDNISEKLIDIFKMEFTEIFVSTLWNYFKIQQVFQCVYIKLLTKLYKTLSKEDSYRMDLLWKELWDIHITTDEWKISSSLIEQSHNYDDFCEYIKEKKRLNAIVEGLSRLINVGIIKDVEVEHFTWVHKVLDECLSIDLTNIVNKSMVDSYIEQIRDYCKIDYTIVPLDIIEKLELLNTMQLQKATSFKIKDFIEIVKK